jgi:hypothetical protein
MDKVIQKKYNLLFPTFSVEKPNIVFIGHETINENRPIEIAHMMPQRGTISFLGLNTV